MTEGTMTLGQLLKQKLDEGKPKDEKPLPKRQFVFPVTSPVIEPVPSMINPHEVNIGIIDAIRLFRTATGAYLAETKWSFDASFNGEKRISMMDLCEWIRAYYLDLESDR